MATTNASLASPVPSPSLIPKGVSSPVGVASRISSRYLETRKSTSKQTLAVLLTSPDAVSRSTDDPYGTGRSTPGTPADGDFRLGSSLSHSDIGIHKCVELAIGDRFGSPRYPAQLDLLRGCLSPDDTYMGARRGGSGGSGRSRSACCYSDVLECTDSPSPEMQSDRIASRHATLAQFNSDSMHSFSFASQVKRRGTFVGAAETQLQPADDGVVASSSNAPSDDYELGDFLPDKEDGPLFPTTSRNPNKALLTIDLADSSVLVANDVACEMFACAPSEIVGVRFPDLLAYSLDRARQSDLIESNIDADGKIIMVKGKVVDVINRHGAVFPVSLWMKMLTSKPDARCIAVMEPVERSSAVLALDRAGLIVHTDETVKSMFGYEPSELVGQNVVTVINAFQLPDTSCTASEEFGKDVLIQEVTARLKSGQRCPVSVAVRAKADRDPGTSFPHGHDVFKHPACSLSVVVWIYANLSGLLTVREDGAIHSCNSSFSRRLFGYDERDLIGKEMSIILPDLFSVLTLVRSEPGSPCYSDIDDDVPLPELLRVDSSQQDDDDDECDVFHTNGGGALDFAGGVGRLPVTSTPDAMAGLTADTSDLYLERHSSASPALLHCSSGLSTNAEPIGPLRVTGAQDGSGVPEIITELGGGGGNRSTSSTSHHYRSASQYQSDYVRALQSISGHTMSPRFVLSPVARHTPVSRTSGVGSATGTRALSSLSNSWRATQQQWASHVALDVSKITGVTLPTTVRHRDGSSLDVLAQVKTVLLDNCQTLFCLWIQRDANVEVDPLCRLDQSYLNISLARNLYQSDDEDDDSRNMSESSSKKSLPGKIGRKLAAAVAPAAAGDDDSDYDEDDDYDEDASHSASALAGGLRRATNTVASFASTLGMSCLVDDTAGEMFSGDYESNYITIKSIGKGAFGEVKLAISRNTSQSVVIKFIRKASVLKESWKDLTATDYEDVHIRKSPDLPPSLEGRPLAVPLEIVLLRRLDHTNIVKAIEVYENDEYYQMVMERHGHGMDLFEFIDQNPRMDEPLTSYIFRQIACAIQYLHANNIVHRDVKDENVIIDDEFNIKLIDFGSAAYMEPTRLFATFCGTLEFCSPEVLLGNQYPGPELEMWSLGVTLYTLVFGENPFVEAEDILTGQLQPPFRVSPGLLKILLWLLHPDPKSRCTINQLLDSAWMRIEVDISNYRFDEVIASGGSRVPSRAGAGGAVESSVSEVIVGKKKGPAGDKSQQKPYIHSHSVSDTM